ncbi:cytochrome c [Roseiconus nitratireducens]|uniref:Cytochrome c n=1 Tax=Roseiconus nitratireducens TaxID=2605748 RepID=A0A5M6D1N7_9BACT|nr:cytochrome c [Roseiconus nitratireducens]KAA5541427.1 cytochrome c [Roseiconus nitratireducens]
MKIHFGYLVATGFLIGTTTGLFITAASNSQAAPPADQPTAADPVEPDMHEYMEYVNQPAFQRLKPAMASEPAGNQAWKTIKSESLVLAESGNLLLIRKPEDDADDWQKHSVQTRDAAAELYRAAKSKDYGAARKHYESMVQHCNACHQQFAGGDPQLKP